VLLVYYNTSTTTKVNVHFIICTSAAIAILFECCCCCYFLLVLDQGSYATGLGEVRIPQVTGSYFGFIEQKSDGIILIETVAACIFQYRTFSH